jgi:hypothetical protein
MDERNARRFAVGNVHLDAHQGEFLGNAALGDHAAPAEIRFFGGNETRKVGPYRVDHRDHGGAGLAGRPVVDAVHVGQDQQGVGAQQGGDQPGQFVVVGKHEFGDRHHVVLVDDGNDAVLSSVPMHLFMLR